MDIDHVLAHLLRVVNEELLRVASLQLLQDDPSGEDGPFLLGQRDGLIVVRAGLVRTQDEKPGPIPPLERLERNWSAWLRTYQEQESAYANGARDVILRYIGYLQDLQGGSS